MDPALGNHGLKREAAYFEHISVPAGQSFLWRMDDYPWRRTVWNYHPEFEIHLIRHSSGLAYVGDHIGSFDAGQLVLVGSNLPHNWITPLIGDQRFRIATSWCNSTRIVCAGRKPPSPNWPT